MDNQLNKKRYRFFFIAVFSMAAFLYGSCAMPKKKSMGNNIVQKPAEQPMEEVLTPFTTLNVTGNIFVQLHRDAEASIIYPASAVTVEQVGDAVTLTGSGQVTLKMPAATDFTMNLKKKAHVHFSYASGSWVTGELTADLNDSTLTSYDTSDIPKIKLTADASMVNLYGTSIKNEALFNLTNGATVDAMFHNSIMFDAASTIDANSALNGYQFFSGNSFDLAGKWSTIFTSGAADKGQGLPSRPQVPS